MLLVLTDFHIHTIPGPYLGRSFSTEKVPYREKLRPRYSVDRCMSQFLFKACERIFATLEYVFDLLEQAFKGQEQKIGR